MRIADKDPALLMRRTLYWVVVVPIYGAAVLYLLRDASPVFFDGSGPMPSFYWGRRILPTAAEYYSRRSYFDLLYLLPYLVAALVITALGCGIARMIVRRLGRLSAHPFWGTAAATLILLLLAAAASDALGLLGAWRGPRILLHRYYLYDLLVMAEVFLPPCILSGFAVVGESRLVRF